MTNDTPPQQTAPPHGGHVGGGEFEPDAQAETSVGGIKPAQRRKPDWWRYTNASSVGIEMAIAIVLGWWVGRWFEANVTHWKPWTSTIGLLLGCGAAGMAIRRVVREYRAERALEEAEKLAAKGGSAGREGADVPGGGKEAAPGSD